MRSSSILDTPDKEEQSLYSLDFQLRYLSGPVGRGGVRVGAGRPFFLSFLRDARSKCRFPVTFCCYKHHFRLLIELNGLNIVFSTTEYVEFKLISALDFIV